LKTPNFKTIPPTLFPPCRTLKNDKEKIEDSRILEYHLTKNLQLKFTRLTAKTLFPCL